MPNTIRLSIVTALMLYAIALPLGIIAARKKGTIIDRSIMLYTFVALSMPTVVMSLINILFFSLHLDWFPSGRSGDIMVLMHGGWPAMWNRLYHTLLPAFTGAILGTVGIIYFLRSEIIDHENSDFVLTARSKGVPENKVYTRHILKNALLPIVGSFGGVIAGVFAGSFFIESVFSFGGMGNLFMDSIMRRDFPIANFLIMFYAIMGVIAVLLTDLMIMIIDPRIRIK